jgi:hypothetical protein
MPDGSGSAPPVLTPGSSDFNSKVSIDMRQMSSRNSLRGNFLRITARIYSQSTMARLTNRVIKVVQSAQTHVFATYSIKGSEEMRWPSQRPVQLHLKVRRNNGNRIDCSCGVVFARWRGLGILSLARLELETATLSRH